MKDALSSERLMSVKSEEELKAELDRRTAALQKLGDSEVLSCPLAPAFTYPKGARQTLKIQQVLE